MKIATCTVSLDGFREPSRSVDRLRVLSEVLSDSQTFKVDLLCLPGGYLMARSISERDEFSQIIRNEAKQHWIAVAIGIDIDASIKHLKKESLNMIKKNTLPSFAICWSPNENILHSWRQRSITSEDQGYCSNDVCAEERILPVRDGRVEVLMCGEIFNERIRNNILSRKDDLSAVVDLGHTSAGFRVWAGMKKLAERGLTVLCSVHANRIRAQKYCYTSKSCKSTHIPDKTFPGPPRLELKLWTFT